MADPEGAASQHEHKGAAAEEHLWVSVARAAALTGCAEEWLMDRCRDGRLPQRPAPEGGAPFVVPLATARALAEREITD